MKLQFVKVRRLLRFITRDRRLLAIFSLIFISQGQLLPKGGIQEFFTDVGFFGLVVVAFLMLRSDESEESIVVENKLASKLSWRLALLGLGIFGVLFIQRWFVAGTANADADITPPIGVAWIAKIFHSFVWSGSNLGAPASNQTQLPWAVVAWTVHELGGSGALAQRIWISLLVGGIFVAAGAFARALEFSITSGVVVAVLYFFNPMTMTFVGDNAVFLVAMILVPALASVIISYGAHRARLWHVCLVFILAAPFMGFAYSNPPIVLMVALTTALTPLLVWAKYDHQSASRSFRAVLIGGFLLVSVSSFWIVPALSALASVATSNLSTFSSWAFTESRSTLTNGLWLNTTWAWSFTTYFPFAANFARFPLDLVMATVPVSAFAILSVRKVSLRSSQRASRLIGVVAILSLGEIFFSTGTKSPGNLVFDPLYHLKYGWLLREPGRFLIAASFGFAILCGLLVEHFQQSKVWWPGHHRRWSFVPEKMPASLFVAVLIIGSGLAASYPLWTGAEISGAHGGFPSTHVRVPKYWNSTAEYLNSSQAPGGALMVLPADDFYQMPYTWYYGTDGFISNLFERNVVNPSAQGYGLASRELLKSVKLESSSLLSRDWIEASRILVAVDTPIVLVRGDINSKFPDRTIASPTKLAEALFEDPEMKLIRKTGELSLFELKPKYRQAFANYATVNSPIPNLKELAMLPAQTALVSSKPVVGHLSLTELPSFAHWAEGQSTLSVSTVLPTDWKYSLHWSGSQNAARLSVSPLNFSHYAVKVTLPIGKSLVENGDFSSGLWSSVGNCNSPYVVTKADTFDASRIRGVGTEPKFALQLSASIDSACEVTGIKWHEGKILLTFETRTLQGAAPRVCVLEVPSGTCAPMPQFKLSNRWHEIRTTLQPVQGTTSLRIFLYADASDDGATSVEQYANVKARALPYETDLTVVGMPSSFIHGGLAVSATGFSTSWIGPNHARHVIVNGLTNGWLTTSVSSKNLHARNSIISVEWKKVVALFFGGLLAACLVWFLTRRRYGNE